MIVIRFVPLDWVALLRREHAPPFVPSTARASSSPANAAILRHRPYDHDTWQVEDLVLHIRSISTLSIHVCM